MENTKKIRVAINGFGRIGRAFLRLVYSNYPEIEIIALNDLGNIDNLAYLLEYDTAQGKSNFDISVNDDKSHIIINNDDIVVLQEKDPDNLPWKELDIDVVIESTGFFTHYDKAVLHLDAGAKHVVISAPGKGDSRGGVSAGTAIMGVNQDIIQTCQITSNGSCTTNASAPLVAILNESIGIEKALLNTIHAYTATQSIVDGPTRGSDFRKGRAGAQNIIPTSTGAAKAVTKALPELAGSFDGVACRVPVVAGSIADITFLSKRDTNVEEIKEILTKASEDPRWQGIFAVSEDPIVSSDIIGTSYASIADLPMIRVVGGNLVKVMAWYDNEMGYTNTLIKHVIEVGKK